MNNRTEKAAENTRVSVYNLSLLLGKGSSLQLAHRSDCNVFSFLCLIDKELINRKITKADILSLRKSYPFKIIDIKKKRNGYLLVIEYELDCGYGYRNKACCFDSFLRSSINDVADMKQTLIEIAGKDGDR